MLYQREGSKFLWFKFEVAGVTYRGSTNETERSRALRVEAQRKIEARAAAPLVSSSRAEGRIRALAVEDVADAERRGCHPDYVRSLRWIWKAIGGSFGVDDTVADVTFDRVREHINRRKAQGIRGQSIRREVSALKRICALAADRGLLLRVPPRWPTVKNDAPHPTRRGKLRRADQVLAVLNALPQDARDEYVFAALTGLRAAEVKRVSPDWMEPSPDGPLLRVPAWAAKDREERIVMLSAPVVEIIRRREASAPVFPATDYQWRVKTASARAGLPSALTLRDLRVYYSTTGLHASGDATAVQEQVGHSNLAMTNRYQRSTLQRNAAVSNAVASTLADPPAQSTRHSRGRSRKKKANEDAALPGKQPFPWEELLNCPDCLAKFQAISDSHRSGGHRSVGTVLAFPVLPGASTEPLGELVIPGPDAGDSTGRRRA